MSINEDTNGRATVTTSIREMIAIIASFVALLIGLAALISAGSTWAVASHRLGVAEQEVIQVSLRMDNSEINYNRRTAEVAVIQSQLSEIRDQNKRILEKINQL